MKKIFLKAYLILSSITFGIVSFNAISNVRSIQAIEDNEILDFSLEAKSNKIIVSIPALTSEAKLVRFRSNKYHSSTPFLNKYDGIGDDNKEDGYNLDRNYYSTDEKGYIEATTTGDEVITIDRYSLVDEENNHDKTYDRFYLIKDGTIIDNTLKGGSIIYGPKFVSKFDSLLTYERESKSSIKGIEVVNSDDAEKLGINYGMVGLDINTIILGKKTNDSIEYYFDGNPYYFSKKNLKTNDEKIINMTKAGISVTLSFLIYASNIGVESILAHPDFVPLANFPMNMSGINVTTIKAINTFGAVASFLADRYTREDKMFGHVDNFIVGNEIESACQWNNMGYIDLDEYIRQYERALRIAYISIKKVWSGANILSCVSHFWNLDVATQYLNYDPATYTPFVGHGSFTARDILRGLNKTSKNEGNYYWQLAYHPYRANAIGESVFWNDVNYIASSHDEDLAAKVTPLNIDVLYNFLGKEENLFEGKRRDYFITEYGAGTPHGSTNAGEYAPEKITEKALNEQAASYAYSYYMFLFNGAKSYVLHRQIDAVYEDGENLGIWFRKTGSEEEPYERKPIWYVLKYIDTPYSLEYTTPYLKYIKTLPDYKTPTSWSELIPNFDPKRLENSNVEIVKDLKSIENYENNFENDDFENNQTSWEYVNSANNALIIKDDEFLINGSNVLMVQYESLSSAGLGIAEKGISKTFEKPINIKNIESFNCSLFIENENKNSSKHFIKIRLYGSNEIYQFESEVKNKVKNSLSIVFDDEIKEIMPKLEKIKIWYSSDDNEAPAGTLYFDNLGFIETFESNSLSAGSITLIVISSFLLIGILIFVILIIRRIKHGKSN